MAAKTSQIARWKALLLKWKRAHLRCNYQNAMLDRYKKLLVGFRQTERQTAKADEERGARDMPVFSKLISRFKSKITVLREAQRKTAEDFNLVKLLELESDERCHTKVLRWMVDKDPFKATHAQGADGFRCFLKTTNLSKSYADYDYSVSLEVSGEESRIDLEIKCRNKFIIHIEVKIDAEETVKGEEKDLQLTRERRDLEERRKSLGVPHNSTHALYLSKDREAHDDFVSISWHQVADAFRLFSQGMRPPSVKWFADHYASAIARYIVRGAQ